MAEKESQFSEKEIFLTTIPKDIFPHWETTPPGVIQLDTSPPDAPTRSHTLHLTPSSEPGSHVQRESYDIFSRYALASD